MLPPAPPERNPEGYTGKYHGFVAVCFVKSTQLVMFVSSIAWDHGANHTNL